MLGLRPRRRARDSLWELVHISNLTSDSESSRQHYLGKQLECFFTRSYLTRSAEVTWFSAQHDADSLDPGSINSRHSFEKTDSPTTSTGICPFLGIRVNAISRS